MNTGTDSSRAQSSAAAVTNISLELLYRLKEQARRRLLKAQSDFNALQPKLEVAIRRTDGKRPGRFDEKNNWVAAPEFEQLAALRARSQEAQRTVDDCNAELAELQKQINSLAASVRGLEQAERQFEKEIAEYYPGRIFRAEKALNLAWENLVAEESALAATKAKLALTQERRRQMVGEASES
jgi:predicted  nucleic acid-binding Zn-ribbon protein